MIKTKVTALCIAAQLLTACATTNTNSNTGMNMPAPIEEKVILNGEVVPLPQQEQITSQALESGRATLAAHSSPVVTRLLDTANQQRQAGYLDGASDSLERALRIEPRNAMLWGRLADVHYAKQDWQQAAQLAAKSNTLAGGNTRLLQKNWLLMVNAYEAIGDMTSANKYREKLF